MKLYNMLGKRQETVVYNMYFYLGFELSLRGKHFTVVHNMWPTYFKLCVFRNVVHCSPVLSVFAFTWVRFLVRPTLSSKCFLCDAVVE